MGHKTVVLKNGSSGARVESVQNNLLDLGYDLGKWGADGDFGSATEKAVKKFQRACGIKADGKVGKDTLAAIEDALKAKDKEDKKRETPGLSGNSKASDAVQPPQIAGHDNLGYLSGISESGSNPGTISTGCGDSGGKSYGAFQFSSNNGVPKDFVNWIETNNTYLYDQLIAAYKKDGKKYGTNFDSAWKNIAKYSPEEFLEMQYLYTEDKYYTSVVEDIYDNTGFDFNSRGYALKNVVFSRAVQHGIGGGIKIISRSLDNLDLSVATDADIISAIYAESGAVVTTGTNCITEANCSSSDKDKQANAIKKAKTYGIYGKYLKYFSGNSTEVQVGVYNRLNNTEPQAALKLLKNYN